MLTFRTPLVLAALGAALAAHAAPVQYSGNGHYYEAILTASGPASTYDAAKTAALGQTYMGMTGHLAQWEDAGELAFIGDTFYPSLAYNSEYWLGAESNGVSDPFRYSTGGLADVSDFNLDYYEGDVREGLGLFNLRGSRYLGDYAASNIANYTAGYVVEYAPQAVPEPSALAALGLGALGLLRRRRKA